ncbi:MAG TPA: type VI secretion system baseplate subunit TssE [Steroidobacteraceae bacterium]|nr:type VI secretion system baseplate subunit TssE [Steroidobacteraceae bacterium]
MAELTPQERLQPALLDRLTDEEPSERSEPRERRVMSRSRVRQAVLRDLAWLFNTTRPGEEIDFDEAPEARRSVLNYGLPALSGTSASMLEPADLEKRIREAIKDFEPRILPETLRVRAVVDADALDHHNVVGIEIHGQLWAQPVPLELLVRTEIDLETGKVEIADLAGTQGG